jgi:hypothetical protein
VFRRKMGQPNTDMRSKVTFFKLSSQRGTGWSVVGYSREREPQVEVWIRNQAVVLRERGSPAEQGAPTYSRGGSVVMLEVPDLQAAIAVRRECFLMVREGLATARSHPSAVGQGLHMVPRAVVLIEDVTSLRTTE